MLPADPLGGATVESVTNVLYARYMECVEWCELLVVQCKDAQEKVQRCRKNMDRVNAEALDTEHSEKAQRNPRILLELGQKVAKTLRSLQTAQEEVTSLTEKITIAVQQVKKLEEEENKIVKLTRSCPFIVRADPDKTPGA